MSVGPTQPKKYGLIIPKSKEAAPIRKRPISSVFNVDSDDDSDVEQQQAKPKKDAFKNMKRQAKLDIQRALEDDPTIYQYDEIYDDMKEEKVQKITLAKQDKTSKYAKNLLRNAAVRKLQNDRHFERKCQKELEDEGDEFADKESFITSSYKKKLEELEILEKEHKRMEEEDRRNDVTKKRDLTDFYRNILQQRTTEITESSATIQGTPLPSTTSATSSSVTETIPTSSSATETIKRPSTNRSYRRKQSTGETGRNTTRHDSTSDSGQSEPEPEIKQEVVDEEEKPEQCTVAKDSGTVAKDSGLVAKDSSLVVKEEPLDHDDRDDSDDSSDSGDEEDEVKPKQDDVIKTEEMDQKPEIPQALLSEEEQREYRIKLIKEACKKRNTKETIQAAVARYWKRRSDGLCTPVVATK